jgi:hypothetical protein
VAEVGDGETISGACRRLGLSRDTVYSLRRRDPKFAAALNRRRAALIESDVPISSGFGSGNGRSARVTRTPLRVVPVDPDAPLPSRDELLRRLDEQSRSGSTRATEILLRALTPGDFGTDEGATADRLLGLVR